MSDATQPKLNIGDAFTIVIGLASANTLTEDEVISDPERLAPQRADQQMALDMVEEFLQFHLYAGCGRCE